MQEGDTDAWRPFLRAWDIVMVSALPMEHILEAVLIVSPNNLNRGHVRPAVCV